VVVAAGPNWLTGSPQHFLVGAVVGAALAIPLRRRFSILERVE
jgi:hypothetical protein